MFLHINYNSTIERTISKKSKEMDDNNPNKNDRKAPKTIASLVIEGRFSYPYIPTGIYAEILVMDRRNEGS